MHDAPIYAMYRFEQKPRSWQVSGSPSDRPAQVSRRQLNTLQGKEIMSAHGESETWIFPRHWGWQAWIYLGGRGRLWALGGPAEKVGSMLFPG